MMSAAIDPKLPHLYIVYLHHCGLILINLQDEIGHFGAYNINSTSTVRPSVLVPDGVPPKGLSLVVLAL